MNKDLNSSIKYKYLTSFTTPGFGFLYGVSAEALVLFDQQTATSYKVYVYRINGQKAYSSNVYSHKDPNRLGQVIESQKKALVFGSSQILTIDLQSMTESIKSFSGNSISFNQDFTLFYSQSGGIYTYPGFTNKISNPITNANIFVYQWYGQYMSIKSFTTNLFLYDSLNGTNGKFFTAISIHGSNNGAMVQDSQAVFFNSQAVSHYDISSIKLLYAEVI